MSRSLSEQPATSTTVTDERLRRYWDSHARGYDREMAFLLLDGKDLLGVGRLAADPGFEQAEVALVVASDRQREGYGELLLRHVVEYAKKRGIQRVIGHVLRENRKMLHLADRLGFTREAGAAGGSDVKVMKFLG